MRTASSEREVGVDTLWGGGVGRQASPCADAPGKVGPESWRLEINSKQDAVMRFSSTNFPDGIQRRRTAVDELNVRSIFEENDVVYAEVCAFQHDGSPELQPMGQKNGKLERGQLLTVSPYLVKRQNQHCYHLEQYGVYLILGRNGFIWVGEHAVVGETAKLMGTELENFTPLETRNHVCRLANAVHVLSALGFTLTAELIVETAEASLSSKVAVNDMVGGEFFVQTAEREKGAARRVHLVRKEIGSI
ncbi:hypothetical protein PAHAL_2G312300 [Panicum hallii]|uniref:Uncharacterized protein n=1 Tax=Panicum hallii TaxID=206008 RepID=A0A2S3H132_9POAL|nr:hypothetical protein PAHAL_2G312300 [Panicum hallii]